MAQHVQSGDTVIDATAGNGNDTLFLAEIVGSGTVHTFDIQAEALDKTKALLGKKALGDKVNFHHSDHRHIPDIVDKPVKAIMFNLGYLPGGDKSLTTSAENSRYALEKCLEILAPGGIISVVTYSGHPGGQQEEDLIANWCQTLDSRAFTASQVGLVNKPNNPPKLWLISKTVR